MTIPVNNGDFLIEDKKAYGTEKIYMIYIKKRIHHGSGTNNYLIVVKKREWYVFLPV